MEKWAGSEGGSGQELRSPKPRISPQRRYLSNSGSAGCSQRLREANFIRIMRSQLSRTAVHSLDSSSAWEQHRSGSHPLLIPVVVHSHHLAPAQANHGKDRLRTPSSAHRYRIRISGRPVRRFDGCGEVHSLREADRKINLPGRLAACFRKLWTRSFEITTTQGLAVTVSARSFAFRLNV